MNEHVSHATPRRHFRRTNRCARLTLALSIVLAGMGCSESTSDPDPGAPGTTEAAPLQSEDPRPSIILVVIESLRTDAVASYGPDRGSPLPRGAATATPHLDALTQQGTRYAWAITASPETVASHASIFSGLRADEHGAGLWTNPVASDDLDTIAEALSRSGYETIGFSENPMAGPEFGLDQGFERFVVPELADVAQHLQSARGSGTGFGIVDRVRRWLDARDSIRPYLLFINLADPHLPLKHHTNNSFMPEGLVEARIDNVVSTQPQHLQICRKLPDPEAIEILGALYLAEVEAADRKLGEIVELTRAEASAAGRDPPNTIVTADHGALFGERRLLGHQFSVDNRVLRVPLVVVPSAPTPGVIQAPVAQWRLADSIRCWSGEEDRCDAGLPIIEPTSAEPIISILGNEIVQRPAAGVVDSGSLSGDTNHANALCEEREGFYGRSVSYIKAPFKFIWRARAPSLLFDLSWDPNELSDQFPRQADSAHGLEEEVEAFVSTRRLDQVHRAPLEGSLRELARTAYEAARRTLLESEKTTTDAVWFAQLCLRARPDPELSAWIDAQIPKHTQDDYYPIILPNGNSPKKATEDLGRGIIRWTNYLLASVARPDAIAMPQLREYLAMDTDGYILTHQLSALEWARAMGRPLSSEDDARGAELLARIAEEHALDPYFSDLWVERAAFLTTYGDPDPQTIRDWVAFIVEHHLGNADWGQGRTNLTFDGQSLLGKHPREHVRGLSMVVLAHYLYQLSPDD